jgi:purine-nucleoside phosphorylase
MNHTLVDMAARAIAARYAVRPRLGLILGTGLGDLVSEMQVHVEVPYADIPYFPRSTAMAHKGHLLCGAICGVPAIIMAGRCHLYEGYALNDLMLPVRVLHALGIELLVVTNAAGGLNPRFQVGDVMVLVDHINLMFPRGTSHGLAVCREGTSSGQQGNQRLRPYDSALIDRSIDVARRNNFPLQCGVYVGVKGPNYETRAEYRAFRKLGGDVVGMSTIPEVLCARELGLRVLGLSTVTNIARPDAPQVVTPADVVAMAGRAEPKVRRIVAEVARELD